MGIVKGVILSRAPGLEIVDLTHEIPPQDIKAGAFVLGSSWRFFPPGTLFLSVVDPGVGSSREILVARAGERVFVAPDNGLLTLISRQEGFQCRYLRCPELYLRQVEPTFHARDIMAPVSAALAGGLEFESAGPPCSSPVLLNWPEPRLGDGVIIGEVIYVDRFGSLVTNISIAGLVSGDHCPLVRVKGRQVPFHHTYSSVPPGHPLALAGSCGALEIAVNQGSAAQFFTAAVGTKVELVLAKGA